MLKKNQNSILLWCLISLSVFNFCKDEEIEKKIDPNLRLALKNLKATSQLDQRLSIVFKVNETLTEVNHDVLKNNSVKIIANIGKIYTASAFAHKIVDLAKMEFVEYIQASREFQAHPHDSTKSPNQIKEFKK